jgi:hypothetical protein
VDESNGDRMGCSEERQKDCLALSDKVVAEKPRDFLIRLQPLADDVPPTIRLRRLLKFAGRCLRLKCVEATEVNRDDGGSQHGAGVVHDPP